MAEASARPLLYYQKVCLVYCLGQAKVVRGRSKKGAAPMLDRELHYLHSAKFLIDEQR